MHKGAELCVVIRDNCTICRWLCTVR